MPHFLPPRQFLPKTLFIFCKGDLIGVANRHWLLDKALPLAASGFVTAPVQSPVTGGSVGERTMTYVVMEGLGQGSCF